MIKVLFVCTGNICRSPTAEGVFRHLLTTEGLAEAIETDSAGTHGYHIGEPPDSRSVDVAAAHGVDLSTLRARKVVRSDFQNFDLILAMDHGHFEHLKAMRPPEARARVALFLDYHPKSTTKDVPDPYYGGRDGFESVLDMVEQASRGLMAALRDSVKSS
jgi:protein-tyrosine phosphatase